MSCATSPGSVPDPRAMRARRPRARYPVGILAWSLLAARRVLPDTLFDAFVRTGFPAP